MKSYFESKMKLFTGLGSQKKKRKPTAIVNIDDRYGEQLLEKIDKRIPVITYGMSMRAEFRASNYRVESSGTSYQLDARGKSYLVRVPMIGRFNVTNSDAAQARVEF
jgi:UDP-N-acetylmuramoyl-L-alanyl-D-glutamate--2,6-diaminopimelate ligase